MGMGLPVAGIVFVIVGAIMFGLWIFPSLPFVSDKVQEHFDLKDEDYEEDKEETEDES